MIVKCVMKLLNRNPVKPTPEVAEAVRATYAEAAKARTVIARIADDDAERAWQQLRRH